MKKKILYVVTAAIITLLLVVAYGLTKTIREGPKLEEVVTAFLVAGSRNDADSALRLMSRDFDESIARESIEKTFRLRSHFAGFRRLTRTEVKVQASTGDAVKYTYSGVVEYDDGDKGDVTATLVKQGVEYKIEAINVKVDPIRIEKFR